MRATLAGWDLPRRRTVRRGAVYDLENGTAPSARSARPEQEQMATKPLEVKIDGRPPVTNRGSLSAYGPARSTVRGEPLSPEALRQIDAYWRACNYLSLGMIYLQD